MNIIKALVNLSYLWFDSVRSKMYFLYARIEIEILRRVRDILAAFQLLIKREMNV